MYHQRYIQAGLSLHPLSNSLIFCKIPVHSHSHVWKQRRGERQVKTSRPADSRCQFDFSLSDGQPVFVKLQPNKLWKTVKSKNEQMLRNLSFLNESVWVVWELIIFRVYTNLTRSTDIYNKSNKLNWTNKTVFTFSGKVRSTLTLTLRVRSCLSWHLDIWTPVTHSPELNAQNNLGAISVDSKTF